MLNQDYTVEKHEYISGYKNYSVQSNDNAAI